ncbi:Bursicon beta subunit [Operophtera brumata]|uniref:Bursicon beta subunit n=1 Tax=Operophtera brumata TaxID=104452 RepID=A0A0L7LUZ3_OPEBR|nr:Bursicon beta subunit [Operophtera brumata]
MGFSSFQKLFVYALAVIFVFAYNSVAEEECETLSTEIHVIKEEYDDIGRLMRSCSGEVSVNKCDGMCTSQVRPSIGAPTGFIKFGCENLMTANATNVETLAVNYLKEDGLT